jgi:hypothetical protein
MSERDDFSFSPDTPSANVVELVSRHHRRGGGVVVDMGCGYGAVAEPLGELGLGYLGIDVAPDGPAELMARGFETIEADLTDPGVWVDDVVKALDGRPMAAVLALGIVEHLTDPGGLIAGLAGLIKVAGPAPLVVCMPNVAHLDLGVKLLLGRWDATHASPYTEARLTGDLAQGGWRELDRLDFHLRRSDHHQPEDCVAHNSATALGTFLREIREGADPNATVNQFVRAYAPVLLPEQSEPAYEEEEQAAGEPPFLSVIVRTQGTRVDTLAETLLSLSAQTCQDFEVLVMAHDIDPGGMAPIREMVASFPAGPVSQARFVPVRGGGRVRPLNAGVTEAKGRYVAILDDDDLAFAHWVECFQRVAEARPGQIVRTGVATQPLGRSEKSPAPALTALDGTVCYPGSFDLPSHLFNNSTPLCGLAIPRSCFRDLGLRFDEQLQVLEDWDLLLRASQYCSVADTGEVTGLYRQWSTEPNALNLHLEDEWKAAKAIVLAKLERHPYLLSRDALAQVRSALGDRPRLQEAEIRQAARIAQLEQAGAELRSELAARDEAMARVQAHAGDVDRARADAEARYADIKASRSWRAAGVLRAVGWMTRRAMRTHGR